MMNYETNDGCGYDNAPEVDISSSDRQVGGDDSAALFIAINDDLEQYYGALPSRNREQSSPRMSKSCELFRRALHLTGGRL